MTEFSNIDGRASTPQRVEESFAPAELHHLPYSRQADIFATKQVQNVDLL